MESGLRSGVIVLVLLVALSSPVVSSQPAPQSVGLQPEPDNTITRLQVHANGSATWTIQVRTRLETDEEVEQFQQFQERLQADESTFLEDFRDRMTVAVRSAANETERPMSAERFDISTQIQEVPQRWGIVSYEFLWIGFAETQTESLVVGDIFQGGFFLSEEDRLVIAPPQGYRIVNSTPPPDTTQDETIAWAGRRDFPDEHPQVIIEPNPTAPADNSDTQTTGNTVGTSSPIGGLFPGNLHLWGLLPVGLLILGGGYLLIRRRRSNPTQGPRETTPSGGPSGEIVTSSDDQILTLLQDSGGQLRQSAIADHMDWSASKTSRVLSEMAESGDIEKLQIGRENIIRFPEESESGRN